MKEAPPTEPPGDDPQEEVAALAQQLQEVEARILQLTGGELDAVTHPDGTSYLLQDAQEHLRKSVILEREFAATQSSILNAIPAAIALIDHEGTIISVNDRWHDRPFCAGCGLEMPAVGENFLERYAQAIELGSQDAQRSSVGIRAVLAGEVAEFTLEFPSISPTGNRWIRQTVNPLQRQEQLGAVVMHADVTEQKRSEGALIKSRGLYRDLFENMLEGFAYCRLLYDDYGAPVDYAYIEVNRAFEPQTGLRNPTGMRVSELVPGIHEANPEQLETYARVARTGKTEHIETYAHPLDAWFAVSVYSNEADHFCVGFDNITERKRAEMLVRESEERFRGTFEQVAVGLAHVSAEGRFLRVNDRLCTISGYSREELLGMQFQKPNLEEDWHVVLEARSQILAGREPSVQVEKPYRRKDGQMVWVNIVTTLQCSRAGDPEYFISVVEDITLRKEAEERLKCLNRLHSVLNELGRVLVGASKEQDLYDAVCEVIVQKGLLRMVLIMGVDPATKTVVERAAYGEGLDYLRDFSVTLTGATSYGTIGTALRTGNHDVCNDFSRDPRMAPWREQAQAHGFRSTASFPLKLDGQTVAALVLFAGETGYFQEDEVALMLAVASEVSFALEAQSKERHRLQAENARRTSDRQFSSAFEHAAVGVALVSAQGHFIKVNPALCQFTGYPEAELMETPFQRIIHPEDLEQIVIKMAQLTTGDVSSVAFETRYLHRKGEVMWAISTVALVRDQPLHFIAQILDITERKRSEAEIQRATSLLRAVADGTPDVVFVKDRQGRYLLCNQAAASLVGSTVQEVLGEDDAALYGEEDARLVMESDRRVMESNRVHTVEEVLSVGGIARTYLATKAPYRDAQGEVLGVIGISTDITDRKSADIALRESEERFRLISQQLAKVLDSSLDAICSFDAHGNFLQVSAACEAIWGYRSEELLGTPYFARVLPEDQARTRDFAHSVMAGKATSNFENRFRRKDGSVAHVTWSARWSQADQSMFCVARDNSEARQAQAETRAVAERLTATLENLSDSFFTVDHDWRFTYVNGEGETLLGRARAELVGRNVWEVFPQRIAEELRSHFERALAENVSIHAETQHPIGRWFEVRAYPSEQGLAIYFRNVSAQRAAREALRLSEERFQLLAKATNDAIWDWDVRTDELWWNDSFEALFGFQRQEIALDFTGWSGFIHPEERERVISQLRAVMDDGASVFTSEYRFCRKDGEYAYVLDRGYIIRDAKGAAVRIISGMTDLTERRRAEERIAEQAALIDKAQDAITVRDLHHHITYWNKSAERLYGWSAQDILHRSARELFYADAAIFDRAMSELMEQGDWTGEVTLQTKEGTKAIVESRWTLVHDSHGQPRSVLVIDTDVTERKKIEQQFLRAQRMESIGTLAGGIAHDLNNVLGPIIMALDLLRMRFPDPSSQDLLRVIGTSARHGADMVGQVLSFARGVEGRRMEIQIKHIIGGVEKITNDTFSKNIRIESIVPRNLWTVLGDPTQLHQVLLNLCVNARDAMPNGGTLSLSAENLMLDAHYAGLNPEAKPGPYITIEVEDSGTGMPADVIEKIFDPFFTTKELGKGTGLGLSTSLAIVKSHGGFFRVYSEPGKGTKFRVYFPAQTEPSAATAEEIAAEMPRGNGEWILVVDDEASVRQITQQTLESFGYRVLVACDGVEAIDIYTTRGAEIAAVLTDIMMPVMDGPATVHVLRNLNPAVRIICASGLAANGHGLDTAEMGVKHFLPKPYSAETLLKVLREVLTAQPESNA